MHDLFHSNRDSARGIGEKVNGAHLHFEDGLGED
jgi:hypothetical protein